MAAKANASASEIDKTSFFWVGNCSICHPGGGPGEFDRYGLPYYDARSRQFGYEKIGQEAADVTLDGDYAFVSPQNGSLSAARWDITGVSEADCLLCHASRRDFQPGANFNWVWRTATLRAMHKLVDDNGDPVAAYSAAPAAGRGWFSNLELMPPVPGKPPQAARLQLDYGRGVEIGDLQVDVETGMLMVKGAGITTQPRDLACWGCHAIADQKKRGRVWFDPDQDVHYAHFNKLTDADPSNDVGVLASQACTVCHKAGMDHEIGKGDSFAGTVRRERNYVDFQTCRDCHKDVIKGSNEPGEDIHTDGHLAAMACQVCHIPYRANAADLVIDNSVTGDSVTYTTDKFLSADPLQPANPDKSRWLPAFAYKADSDGNKRFFPSKLLLTVWWGDWDQNGTPVDLGDDVVAPLILWRVRQITGGQPLPVVTDDNGDGVPEVNNTAEILAYLEALRGNDSHGNPVATNPVLVKGGRIWFEDPAARGTLASIEFEGTGMRVESSVHFSTDHNILPKTEALGDCKYCHAPPSKLFDRKVLLDPFGEDGKPVYETVNRLLGR